MFPRFAPLWLVHALDSCTQPRTQPDEHPFSMNDVLRLHNQVLGLPRRAGLPPADPKQSLSLTPSEAAISKSATVRQSTGSSDSWLRARRAANLTALLARSLRTPPKCMRFCFRTPSRSHADAYTR